MECELSNSDLKINYNNERVFKNQKALDTNNVVTANTEPKRLNSDLTLRKDNTNEILKNNKNETTNTNDNEAWSDFSDFSDIDPDYYPSDLVDKVLHSFITTLVNC